MQRRQVLFYLYLALTAPDDASQTAWLVRAIESTRRIGAERSDLSRILETRSRASRNDEIDTVMGMIEMEQGVAAPDRGVKQCAATRYLRWREKGNPRTV